MHGHRDDGDPVDDRVEAEESGEGENSDVGADGEDDTKAGVASPLRIHRAPLPASAPRRKTNPISKRPATIAQIAIHTARTRAVMPGHTRAVTPAARAMNASRR